jgi:hypothetical protein
VAAASTSAGGAYGRFMLEILIVQWLARGWPDLRRWKWCGPGRHESLMAACGAGQCLVHDVCPSGPDQGGVGHVVSLVLGVPMEPTPLTYVDVVLDSGLWPRFDDRFVVPLWALWGHAWSTWLSRS